jgi:hypothetical protein
VIDGLLADLGNSALAAGLRGSYWAYPALNALHVLGIALLVGGILPLDLRLLGLWRTVPAAPLAAVLVPSAVAGVVLVLATGPLLFAVRPEDYAANPYFQAKLAVVACAILNALLLRRAPGWRRDAGAGARVRLAAVLSLALWLAALFCGRMIAYY